MKEMRQVWMTEDGWIAERVDECTCSPHYGAHEPTCGWEPIGKLNDAAPLRAAVEALAVEYDGLIEGRNDPGCDDMDRWIQATLREVRDRLRALLADDGAAALREVKADAFEDGARKTAEIAKAYDADLILPVSPYRDAAGEAGDE